MALTVLSLCVSVLAAGPAAVEPCPPPFAPFVDDQDPRPANAPNPKAVLAAEAHQLRTVNAAWWGFDPEDSTDSIQKAINTGARRVVVPYMGRPWIVRPIVLGSDMTLEFEPGVLVLAKKGEFKGKNDCLFRAANANNITIRGYGATLRMRKKDYQSDAYEKAEWRMTLDFMGCKNVCVEGVRLESSGGDGIYLGATAENPICQNVVIRDVVCHDHHRQGISVIGALNLLIENCIITNTSGTAPQAGIDFEPNGPQEKLKRCVVRNCIFDGNAGAAVLVYLKNLSRETDRVRILVDSCHVRGGVQGLVVGAVKDDGPVGFIEFRNCTVENTRDGGVWVYDKSVQSARVRFVDCKWNNVCTSRDAGRRAPSTPLLVTLKRPELAAVHGGIDFINCTVYDERDRPVLVVEPSPQGLRDLRGVITVANPNGTRADFGPDSKDVVLKLVENTQ